MSKKLLVLVLVLSIANLCAAPADDHAYFDNNAGGNTWMTAGNWVVEDNSGNPLPRALPWWTLPSNGTNAYIGADYADIVSGDSVRARGLLDIIGTAGVVNQTGGTFELMGYWFGEKGGGATYNISGGTLDVLGAYGDAIIIGQNFGGSSGIGVLNVSGDALVIGQTGGLWLGKDGGNGTLNISDTAVVQVPYINDFSALIATLDISDDGRLVIEGNKMSYLQPGGRLFAAIGNGKMTANGVGGGIQSAFIKWYDSATDTTIVKVPEPATIALLGMGAMALIRRKR